MSQVTGSSTVTPTDSSATRPIGRWLWVVIGLTGLMVYRAIAAVGLTDLGDGTPDFWIVALTGDAFIGVTAPIVAFLLWKRRGLAIWTIAIAWHVTGIKVFLAGSQFLAVDIPDRATVAMLAPIFGVGIAFHLLTIYLLIRFRRHYLG